MRILWITNSISPVLNKAIGLRDSYGGGWVFALARQLSSYKEIKLCIATVYNGKEIKYYDIDGVEFTCFRQNQTLLMKKN